MKFTQKLKANKDDIFEMSIDEIVKTITRKKWDTGYEIFDNIQIVKPYFDIDKKISNKKENTEEYKKDIINNALEFLKKHFLNANFAISQSHREDKISFHVLITNYKTTSKDLKAFYDSNKTQMDALYFDNRVYNKTQKFRLLNCRKNEDGKISPYKTAIDKFDKTKCHEHIVQYIEENAKEFKYDLLNVDIDSPKQKIKNGCHVKEGHTHSTKNHSKIFKNENGTIVANCFSHGSKIISSSQDDTKIEYLIHNQITDRVACNLLTLRYLYKDKILYIFNEANGQWLNDISLFYNDIIKLERSLKNLLNANKQNEEDEDYKNNMKILKKNIAKLQSTTFMTSVKEHLQIQYAKENITLNNAINGIMFTNGLYDFNTFELRKGRPDEYITFSTGYEYVESKIDIKQEIYNKFLNDLMSESHLKFLLTAFSIAMAGTRENEDFYILTGSASNGKSSLFDLIKSMLGEYYKPMDITQLTCYKKSANEANAALHHAQGRRIIQIDEPEQSSTLIVSRIKEISGGDQIKCRALYSNTETIYKPQFTMFILCNDMPSLSKIDEGLARRLNVVEFPNKFCENPKLPHEKPINKFLKTKYLASLEWKQQFFNILVDHLKTYDKEGRKLTKPIEITAKSNEYLAENDVLYQYLESRYDMSKIDETHKNHWHNFNEFYELYKTITKQSKLSKSLLSKQLKTLKIKIKNDKMNTCEILLGSLFIDVTKSIYD